MIIDTLDECCDIANRIASEKSEKDSQLEREDRENNFIKEFEQLMNQIDVLYEMNKISHVDITKKELTEIKSVYEKGKRIVEKAKLSRSSNDIESIRNAKGIAYKPNKKWIKKYKNDQDLQKLQNMLKLINSIYIGKPSAKTLSIVINRVFDEDKVLDKEIIISAGNAINEAKSIINSMEINDEVAEFLEKVSGGNANLSDLDDGVMKWLRDNNLLHKISITIQ